MGLRGAKRSARNVSCLGVQFSVCASRNKGTCCLQFVRHGDSGLEGGQLVLVELELSDIFRDFVMIVVL